MAIGLKSNIDGSGELLNNGVNLLTLGNDNSVKGLFKDTDGSRIVGVPRHNYIVDGAFDFWYEGTSQTTSGYGSDTMWSNSNMGSAKTHSRQSFAVGSSFPDGVMCPSYFSRTVVSSVAGVGNSCSKNQRIESVNALAGKRVAISFYAKADSTKNISIELAQVFGDGGSPSANVTGIGAQKIELSAAWTKYSILVDIPSISGKVIGTNANDSTFITFWFDAGSNLNARTDSLGQQSGTFDLALVKLEEGEVATPYVRDVGYELQRVQRYYFVGQADESGYILSGWTLMGTLPLAVGMRSTPTTSLSGGAFTNTDAGKVVLNGTPYPTVRFQIGYDTANAPARWIGSYIADARL